MALAICGLIFLILTLLITYYGYQRYTRPGRYYEHVGVATETETAAPGTGTIQNFVVRVFEQVGEMVPASPQDLSITRRYLIAGGFRSERAVTIHYGVKVVLCAALLLVAVVFRSTWFTSTIMQNVVLIAFPAAGYFLPNFILERMVAQRQERLRLGLPDALDLMVVCVEAGLALDQATLTVSRRLAKAHKDLSDEFRLLNLEMRAGTRRVDALRNLADRTAEPTLKELVAILVQTDRFGTSVADSLRSHAEYMRVKRRQDAEEKANKIGVKLVFPIFFFLMPAMVIVAAGPALLQLFKELSGIVGAVTGR
jgi:tight adherence protein C